MTRQPDKTAGTAALIGIAAVAFSVLYFVSDLIELSQAASRRRNSP